MTLKKILASRSSSSFIFRYIFNTHKELSRSSPIKIPDASMLLLSIRDVFQVQKIIIIISISNKMIKMEIFLEWCKLSLISYIILPLITQNVCRMGTSRNADISSSSCLSDLEITLPECLQMYFPVMTQCHRQWLKENSSLIKSKLESLNSKAQLSWNASFFLWPCNINYLVKQ